MAGETGHGRLAGTDAPELAALLARCAEDEARHYDWAFGALRELGCGPETAVG